MLNLRDFRRISRSRESAESHNHVQTDLDFMVVDWHAEDATDDESGDKNDMTYVISAYGITRDGVTIFAEFREFKPYFFVEIQEHWSTDTIAKIIKSIQERVKKLNVRRLTSWKVVRRKKMAGFDNGKEYKFLKLIFRTKRAMNDYIKAFDKPVKAGHMAQSQLLKCWESNIDPLLRFFHTQELQPAGWIRLSSKDYLVSTSPKTQCQIEITANSTTVRPFEPGVIAPLTIASFDIEADSSHGDFPLAIKNYRKLAYELAQHFTTNQMSKDPSEAQSDIRRLIRDAFDHDAVDGELSKLHPSRPLFDAQIHAAARVIDEEKTLRDLATLKYMKSAKKDKDTARMLRRGETYSEGQERLTNQLVTHLDDNLPELNGDRVIQIGTNVTRHGDPDFLIQYVATLDSCDSIDDVYVDACKTEKEVLTRWCDFIIQVDPDVIISWNGWGFDEKFLWDRASELRVADRLAKLSRDKTLKQSLQEKKLTSSALGENIYHFLPMRGRINIDLMKNVQNNASIKLESYSLDSVSSHFMRGRSHPPKWLYLGLDC